MKILTSLLLTLFFSVSANCHEGHNVPGSVKALHGGTGLGGKEINLEFLVSEEQLMLFPLSHEGKDLGEKEVKVSATAKSPKGKAEKISLNFSNGAFQTKIDFKNSYRVEIIVSTEFNNKKDNFKFQIER